MYSLRKAGSSLETMANTTSLPRRGFMPRYSSNPALRARSSASVSTASSALPARTGAGRTSESRKSPLASSTLSFARYLPSTRTFTRSPETRSTCLTSATTP